jgi:DNA topoisomerase-3
VGKSGTGEDACGFSFGKSPAGRTFEVAEAEALLRDKHIGPLEGFRSKAGWPFTAEIILKYDEEESKNWKLEFDFGDDKNADTGEIVDFSEQDTVGPCPICGAPVFEHGSNYVCEKSVPTNAQPTPSCTFKTGKIILQQPVERPQMEKLLATGKTDLLDKFVSMRTRRAFKAFLTWNAEEGKVTFEFAPREGGSKFPPRKTFGKPAGQDRGREEGGGEEDARGQEGAGREEGRRAAQAPGAGLKPSDSLAAVIGTEPVARTEVIKKLWDYIKANGLQDATNKRAINADAKLKPVFGKDQVTMFELAGIVGKHLSAL